jgi:hypothetical protein
MAPVSPFHRSLNAGSRHHEIGWLVFSFPESSSSAAAAAAATQTPAACSLQSLTLPVLAKALPDYIEANGVKAVRDLMGHFPSETLSSFSIFCSEMVLMTMDVMAVLCHSHAQRMAFYFNETVEEEDWLMQLSLESSHALERLELVNVKISNRGIGTLFRICPSLTHLSISRSQLTDDRVANPSVFHKLQVLDVSQCEWINESLLKNIIRPSSSLEVLSVRNCQYLEEKCCLHLNLDYQGVPVLSVKRQTKDR